MAKSATKAGSWPLPVPPLHPMERGPGGEAASGPPALPSCSPSPLVERGRGGEVDCFRLGTLIKTQHGWRAIETIRAGDLIWTHRARLCAVLGVQSHPHVGSMLGVQLENNSAVVWYTPDHQFLTMPGPHPPTPSPPAERGSKKEEVGGALSLTPQPPLHPMERGSRPPESKSPKSVHSQIQAALGGLNPALIQLARELRRESTEPEAKLWQCLRSRQLNGFKFRRQHPLGPHYISDFYCAEAQLSIEL